MDTRAHYHQILSERLPNFDNHTLVQLRKKQVDGLKDLIEEKYKDIVPELWDTQYVGYDILNPTERIKLMLQSDGTYRPMNKVDYYVDACELVRYNFVVLGERMSKLLLVPYLTDYSSFRFYEGKSYHIPLQLNENLFWTKAQSVCITMNLERNFPQFYRNLFSTFNSLTSEYVLSDNIVTTVMYSANNSSKDNKDPHKTTLAHYLLAKFGLEHTINRLGGKSGDIQYANKIGKDTEEFEYFRACGPTSSETPHLMLKIRKKHLMEGTMISTLGATMLNSMVTTVTHTYESYIDDDKPEWIVMMAKSYCDKSNRSNGLLFNYMTDHIASFDKFLDKRVQSLLEAEGIICNDMYDLITYIWINFGMIMSTYRNNNMYNKNLTALENSISTNWTGKMNSLMFKLMDANDVDKTIAHKKGVVKKILRIGQNAKLLEDTFRLSVSKGFVKYGNASYHDNWLMSNGGTVTKNLGSNNRKSKKQRSLADPTIKLHSSNFVVETGNGLTTSNPSSSMLINPFLEVDHLGRVRDNGAKAMMSELDKYTVTKD